MPRTRPPPGRRRGQRRRRARRAGVPAAWVGRLGDDEFGDPHAPNCRRRGVDVRAIEVDPDRPDRPTTKPPPSTSTASRERSRMPTPGRVRRRRPWTPASSTPRRWPTCSAAPPWCHCSGITAALSDSCAALMRRCSAPAGHRRAAVSFDVNWREQLWPDGDPADGRGAGELADLVLVGADEALRVLGTADPDELRALLPGPGHRRRQGRRAPGAGRRPERPQCGGSGAPRRRRRTRRRRRCLRRRISQRRGARRGSARCLRRGHSAPPPC